MAVNYVEFFYGIGPSCVQTHISQIHTHTSFVQIATHISQTFRQKSYYYSNKMRTIQTKMIFVVKSLLCSLNWMKF